MGPASERNLKIAPAFYITQFDLTRSFKANSKHNKRTTLKIWLVVFGCVTTITINIKVMGDYSTTTFFQAFTRISCEVGYPKKLSPNEGSQLIKGCSSTKLEGDVVLFLKEDFLFSRTGQYGTVLSVQQSSDNVIRKVKVKYRNANENVDRETFRSVRQLVMIHPVDEIDIIQELNNIKN